MIDCGYGSLIGFFKKTPIPYAPYFLSPHAPKPPNSKLCVCTSDRCRQAKTVTLVKHGIAQIWLPTLNLGVSGDYVGYCWALMRWPFSKSPVHSHEQPNLEISIRWSINDIQLWFLVHNDAKLSGTMMILTYGGRIVQWSHFGL